MWGGQIRVFAPSFYTGTESGWKDGFPEQKERAKMLSNVKVPLGTLDHKMAENARNYHVGRIMFHDGIYAEYGKEYGKIFLTRLWLQRRAIEAAYPRGMGKLDPNDVVKEVSKTDAFSRMDSLLQGAGEKYGEDLAKNLLYDELGLYIVSSIHRLEGEKIWKNLIGQFLSNLKR